MYFSILEFLLKLHYDLPNIGYYFKSIALSMKSVRIVTPSPNSRSFGMKKKDSSVEKLMLFV